MKKPIKEVMEKASGPPEVIRLSDGKDWEFPNKYHVAAVNHWNKHGPRLLEAFERFIVSVADDGGFNGSFSGADEAIKAASEVEAE